MESTADPVCWSWEPPADDEWIHCRDLFPKAAQAHLTEADLRLTVMLEWHRGRCAICGRKTALVEDHDHATAMVRGYLCRSCNIREGDGVFVKYRERNPASICGVQQRYWNPITQEYAEPAAPVPPYDPWTDNPLKGAGL